MLIHFVCNADSYARYVWDGSSIKENHREKVLSKWHSLSQQERLEILRSLPDKKGGRGPGKSPTPSKRRYHDRLELLDGQDDSLLSHADPNGDIGSGGDEDPQDEGHESSHRGSSSSSLYTSSHAKTEKEATVRCLLQVIACEGVSDDIKQGAQDKLVELLGIKKRKRDGSSDDV
jgi:hypothetical protein